MAKNRVHNEIDSLETTVSSQSSAISSLQSSASAADAHIALVGNEGQAKNPHGVTAADVGAPTVEDLSNAIAGVINDIDWKEMVATFEDLATTYPSAVEGWTASVAADNITYRYDGTQWVPIAGQAVPLATANNDGLLSSSGFTKLAGIESGAKDDQSADEVPYDNTHSTLIATNVESAIDELDLKKLDATALSASLALYPTDTPSDILAPAFKLVTSTDDPDFDTTPVDINTPTITGIDQPVGRIVSEPGIIVGSPGVITISTIGEIRKSVGNDNENAAFYYTVSRYDGVAQQIVTPPIAVSDTTQVVKSTVYEEFFAFALLNNGVFGPQDRIVIDYFANVVDNPGAVYQFKFGGDAPVRTLLPVPVSVIPSPDASGIIVDTTNFNGILDGQDDNVQAALETLDDHNHDERYFTEGELNPLYEDPQNPGQFIPDFGVTGILDGRYANYSVLSGPFSRIRNDQWNAGRLNGIQYDNNGTLTQIENYADATIGFDQRLDDLEAATPFDVYNYTDSIPTTGWTGSVAPFTRDVILGGTQTSTQTETYAFNFQDNQIGNNDFANLPPQQMSFNSTSTTDPITITKAAGQGAFQSKFVGAYLFVQDSGNNVVYYITNVVDGDNLTAYYQPGPSQGATLSKTTYDFNSGANELRFNFVVNNGTQNGNVIAQIAPFEEQTQQNYSVQGVVKGGSMQKYFNIPTNATAITGLTELNNAGAEPIGLRYYAIIIDNTAAFVSKAEGLRKIARNNNGTIEINVSGDYLQEQWSQAGGNMQFITPYAIETVGANRVTAAEWANATVFPNLTGASQVTIAIGLASETTNGPGRTEGVDIDFEISQSLGTVFGVNDDLLFDVNITSQNFANVDSIEAAWSDIKIVEAIAENTVRLTSKAVPSVAIPIKFAVLK